MRPVPSSAPRRTPRPDRCYVGKKRLDKAISLWQAKNPSAQVSVNW
jgi:hypothetical protein